MSQPWICPRCTRVNSPASLWCCKDKVQEIPINPLAPFTNPSYPGMGYPCKHGFHTWCPMCNAVTCFVTANGYKTEFKIDENNEK